MHNNYYFLRQVSLQLRSILCGYPLKTCFSQNKDELILGFALAERDFYIKAHLPSDFCCLFFPEDFHRSKKNSVALFTSLIPKKVQDICQYDNERCFGIRFEEGYELLFKMHGNRSNVILFQEGSFHSMFKNNLQNDRDIQLASLDRRLEANLEMLHASKGDYKTLYPTFGKVVGEYLKGQGYEDSGVAQQWEQLQSVESELQAPKYYLTRVGAAPTLSLLPVGKVMEECGDPITAINRFFLTYIGENQLNREKNVLLNPLQKSLKQSLSYIKKTTQKLREIKGATRYEVMANILMANLHQIDPQSKEVELHNFYDDSMIKIKLKQGLSPQKNAEAFYRKSKNQKIEIAQLEETLSRKQEQAESCKEHIDKINGMDSLKVLRAYAKEHELSQKSGTTQRTPKPYTEFRIRGFSIWVGRNAKSNDELTLKYTWKEDLWLHAKDVSGSHVVIKHQAGKTIPKDVIEQAAALAAHYSKRKNDSLCPVIVTPKKYVRKRKGDPPGAVVVEKEEVILIKPEKPDLLNR